MHLVQTTSTCLAYSQFAKCLGRLGLASGASPATDSLLTSFTTLTIYAAFFSGFGFTLIGSIKLKFINFFPIFAVIDLNGSDIIFSMTLRALAVFNQNFSM